MITLENVSPDVFLHISAYFSRKYLIHDAIFSDTTANFVSSPQPREGEKIVIKIRAAKGNADVVCLCSESGSTPMKKVGSDVYFDYWAATVPVWGELNYYFSIHLGASRCFFNQQGARAELDASYNFRVISGFSVPEWAQGAVMYQIFVDRFYNGDKKNDPVNNEYAYLGRAAKKIDNWRQKVANDDICNFYGGDLKGVMEKLDYLSDLGVECIYFNPIFVSPSTHKYDIQDYDYVDPHFGEIVADGGEPLSFERFRNKYASMYMQRTTKKENLEASNELFQKLVAEAHKRGIKVILDGVFNHCGAFNKWLDREGFYSGKGYPNGAYLDKHSPYHSYFLWHASDWPNNDAYDAWWGHDNHPKLNYEESPELYNYVLEIGKKWVSPPFNADGWRLDVAADLGRSPEFNHKFWRDFRKAVKSGNPDALILAEHYGDAKDWLRGDQWDSIMNYDAFMEPITWFLTGMEKHSESFNEGLLRNGMALEDGLRFHMSRFTYQSLHVAMNELSNHDHSRFLTRTNMKVGRLHTAGAYEAERGVNPAIMLEAVAFQMTWPGAPTVYYGDEAGLAGWTDPDNRRTYPWGSEDKVLLGYHKHMIGLRKKYPVFKSGSVQFLSTEYGILTYARFDARNKFVVALNNNTEERILRIPVWKAGIADGETLTRLAATFGETWTAEPEEVTARNGEIQMEAPPFSSFVFAL
ncbi:MAG: glycoside hydrolase family 13 protein [Clostridiales bacterium]|jgi:alpha-glucosidase|nr:glycoside hydrolase family 13 protein [Clostridiales bacterium]